MSFDFLYNSNDYFFCVVIVVEKNNNFFLKGTIVIYSRVWLWEKTITFVIMHILENKYGGNEL